MVINGNIPSGYLLHRHDAMEAMAHLVRCFTELNSMVDLSMAM